MTDTRSQLVHRYFEYLTGGDIAAIVAMFAPGAQAPFLHFFLLSPFLPAPHSSFVALLHYLKSGFLYVFFNLFPLAASFLSVGHLHKLP